eukprot:CAMPEP_0183745838 /NCGR_PEP_ID=MMETSP0737-20130205/66446_1 /TAXON_ID=385413 /ORGANISM="Thalassiosira miniscula, Strain CCMP1093" /LENGTH=718 /DNA_ID=CAMNT_0025981517 /DNA_START=400 /DNA_END=2556 /DNA_ORIENTATION=-
MMMPTKKSQRAITNPPSSSSRIIIRSASLALLLLLLLPYDTSSFSLSKISPRPKSVPRLLSPPSHSSSSSSLNHRIGRHDHHPAREDGIFNSWPSMDRDGTKNETDWFGSPSSSSLLLQDDDDSQTKIISNTIVEPNNFDTTTTLFEQELLAGYIAHQSLLLNSMSRVVDDDDDHENDDPSALAAKQKPELSNGIPTTETTRMSDTAAAATVISKQDTSITAAAAAASLSPIISKLPTVSSYNNNNNLSFSSVAKKKTTPKSTTPSSQPSKQPFFPILHLSDICKARLLLLLSAALYGTNFTLVKSLDESITSVGVSSTLRFGFAAVVMLPWLFAPLDEELLLMNAEAASSSSSSPPSVSESASSSSSASVPSAVSVVAGEREEGHDAAAATFAAAATTAATTGTAATNTERHDKEKSRHNHRLFHKPTRLSAGLAGMEIGLYNSIGYIAQAVGLKTTTASKSAFICSMAVVTVPILDCLWGKRLLKRQIIGACLAAFGVGALELGGGGVVQEGSHNILLTNGDIMSLIQPIMFGIGFWRMEAAMEKYPTEAGRLAAAQLLMVFLVSLSYLVCWPSLSSSSPSSSDLLLLSSSSSSLDNSIVAACNVLPTPSELLTWLQNPSILGMLLWTGVVTTAFTIYMETLALKTLSAAETTLIFSTEPLFGAAFAAVVANECLGVEGMVGAGLIIGGCIVSGMDVGRLFGREETMAVAVEESKN